MKSKIAKIYSKRTQIDVYDLEKEPPSEFLIKELLETTHDLVPSKQRFMPYKIHVLGPAKIVEKEELYKLTCHVPNNGKGRASYHNQGSKSPYVLIFTARLCNSNDPSIQTRIKRGHKFSQCDPERYKSESNTVNIEIGMFASILTGLCMEKGLDVSYIKCYPDWHNGDDNPWQNLDFVDDDVYLIMGIGYRDPNDKRKYADTEFKPDYNEVINWVK